MIDWSFRPLCVGYVCDFAGSCNWVRSWNCWVTLCCHYKQLNFVSLPLALPWNRWCCYIRAEALSRLVIAKVLINRVFWCYQMLKCWLIIFSRCIFFFIPWDVSLHDLRKPGYESIYIYNFDSLIKNRNFLFFAFSIGYCLVFVSPGWWFSRLKVNVNFVGYYPRYLL